MIQALATNYRRGSQDPGISINQLRFSQSIFYVYGEAARRDSYPRCARSTLGLNCAHVFRASGVQRRAPEDKNRGRTSVYRERSAIGLSPALRLKNRESEAPRHKAFEIQSVEQLALSSLSTWRPFSSASAAATRPALPLSASQLTGLWVTCVVSWRLLPQSPQPSSPVRHLSW